MGDKNEGKRDNWKISKDIYKEEVYGVTEVDRYQNLLSKIMARTGANQEDNVKYDYYSIKWKKENDNAGDPVGIVGTSIERSLAAAAVAQRLRSRPMASTTTASNARNL